MTGFQLIDQALAHQWVCKILSQGGMVVNITEQTFVLESSHDQFQLYIKQRKLMRTRFTKCGICTVAVHIDSYGKKSTRQ